MAKFIYNNAKNSGIGHKFFKLNYHYHCCVLYKEDINSCFKFKSVNKLLIKL